MYKIAASAAQLANCNTLHTRLFRYKDATSAARAPTKTSFSLFLWVLHMWTSALFGAKNFGFFEIYNVCAWTRGVEPVRTFCGQGGGVNFSQFCADVFYG